MSDNTENAFPRPHYTLPNGDIQWGENGLTKREYFAAAALTGICAAMAELKYDVTPGSIAREAYALADAMLEAGRKQP